MSNKYDLILLNEISELRFSKLNIFYSYSLYRFWQLRIESIEPIFSGKYKKGQTGNILDVSGIWKHRGVSNAINAPRWLAFFINIKI